MKMFLCNSVCIMYTCNKKKIKILKVKTRGKVGLNSKQKQFYITSQTEG